MSPELVTSIVAVVTAVGAVANQWRMSRAANKSADVGAMESTGKMLLDFAKEAKQQASSERRDATDARIALDEEKQEHRKCIEEVQRLEKRIDQVQRQSESRIDNLVSQSKDRESEIRRIKSETKKNSASLRSFRQRPDGGYFVRPEKE